ncbi:MAG: FIST C-terminal domain-containing protein [Deltaproteobacteria bacterium]|nr:FIST C-terminal domain-containing protein [Deltaproteobacteria bacterium]
MNVGVGWCNEKNAFLAGKNVAENAIENGGLFRYDFVIAFCSGQLDHNNFFEGIQSVVGTEVPVIGGSAIGIITNDYLSYEGYPAGIAIIQSDNLQHKVAVTGNLDKDEKTAGSRLAEKLADELKGKLLLLFYDSIKTPPTEEAPPVLNASSPLIQGIEKNLISTMPIIGAGLIGDYDFGPTKQFCGSCVDSQCAVGAMLSGDFTPYFRIMHGCSPLDGIYHKITKIEGSAIYELDGKPVVEIIDELYGNNNWHKRYPVDLLTIGINYGGKFDEPEEANYVNRLIMGVLPDGQGINIFEPDLAPGLEIQFMLRDSSTMIQSARQNSDTIMERIRSDGKKALFGIYIDCAGRTARQSNTITEEAIEVQKVFNENQTPLIGFYSGVEVAPLFQKSRGLDWTGVLLIFAK